jgi:hypothetical protein
LPSHVSTTEVVGAASEVTELGALGNRSHGPHTAEPSE